MAKLNLIIFYCLLNKQWVRLQVLTTLVTALPLQHIYNTLTWQTNRYIQLKKAWFCENCYIIIPVGYIVVKLNNLDSRECNILNIFDEIVNIYDEKCK